MIARRIVAVIPCSATKLDRPAPAAELYAASAYFRGALAAALAETDEVYVLSARHGLVALDEVLAPYDVRMGDAGSVTELDLAAQALALGLDGERTEVYGFLPNAYFNRLDGALRMIDVYATPVYEATIGIGEHKRVCKIVATAVAA